MPEESADKVSRKQQRENDLVICYQAVLAVLEQHEATFQVIEQITFDGAGIAHHTHQVRVVSK
jgi:hypothetical protein